jgi:hypothetical protein
MAQIYQRLAYEYMTGLLKGGNGADVLTARMYMYACV